jgi:hypothetical protein
MTQRLELPGIATCGHRHGARRGSLEPEHYGVHDDGKRSWTKDMKLPPWVRQGRVTT